MDTPGCRSALSDNEGRRFVGSIAAVGVSPHRSAAQAIAWDQLLAEVVDLLAMVLPTVKWL